ncbi:unnamed protein product [Coregonus sp. 'balchen']|nr:unnamed protein product [Coregonus sp. 'balchen']
MIGFGLPLNTSLRQPGGRYSAALKPCPPLPQSYCRCYLHPLHQSAIGHSLELRTQSSLTNERVQQLVAFRSNVKLFALLTDVTTQIECDSEENKDAGDQSPEY